MEVITFTESNKGLYTEFVRKHHNGTFLQSWSWGDFQTTLGKTAVRFGVTNKDELIGITQLFLTHIPHLSGFYLYAPYGPLLTDPNNELAITSLVTYIKEQYPQAWFIRLEPTESIPLHGTETQRIQPSKTLVTDITKTPDELLAAMHYKTRYNIKVAAKHQVAVHSDTVLLPDTTNNARDAIALLVDTAKRQTYHSYPASYYEALVQHFSEEANGDMQLHLYEALYENKVVASAIIVDHGNTRTYLFGGSDNAYKHVMAPYAMHWQAIQEAKHIGLSRYDWWGIETATGKLPGFVQFKLRWGGEQITYPPAIDIVQSRGWYAVYRILRAVNRLL